jgi:hypothetical protein
MSDLQASTLLARVGRVSVPPDLLRDVLHAHAQAGTRSAMSGPVDSLTRLILRRLAAGPLSGSQTDIAREASNPVTRLPGARSCRGRLDQA